jgi:hypothetical protein
MLCISGVRGTDFSKGMQRYTEKCLDNFCLIFSILWTTKERTRGNIVESYMCQGYKIFKMS